MQPARSRRARPGSCLVPALLALLHPAGLAAQANNDCPGALTVGLGINPPVASLPFTNAAATTSLPPWSCGQGGNDLWYRFTAACTGLFTVSTIPAAPQPLDTTLEVFAGATCPSAAQVADACNDDLCGRESSITLPCTSGQVFLVRVGGFLGALGTFRLNIACTVAGDECTSAVPVGLGQNGPFTNAGATTSALPWPCIGAGRDVWFTHVATCCGNLTVDTCGSALDTVLEVLAGDCCAPVSLGCNDDAPTACPTSPHASSLTVPVGTGFTYLIRVGGAGNATGAFRLNLNCAPVTPANDECAGAVPVVLGVNGPFDNFCATTNPAMPWPCGSGLDDVWFGLLATATGPHVFATCGADFDTVLEVLQGPCNAPVSLGCNDDAPVGTCDPALQTLQSHLRVSLTNGFFYFVRVGGFGGAAGHFPLEIRQPAHLVGLTELQSTVAHQDPVDCAVARCTPPAAPGFPGGFPPTTGVPYNGGSAWDSILGGAWISNGPTIACVDDACGYLCAPGAAATAPATITGLEVVETQNQLWATDSLGNIRRMTRACPPALVGGGTCSTGLVPGPQRGLSGLAVDEGSQLVFYSEADFAAGTTTLHVATVSTPCVRIASVPVPAQLPVPCGTVLPIRGLAVDPGNRTLYLTDGTQTLAWGYTAGPGPSITFDPVGAIRCCPAFAGDRFVGLAWQPAGAVPAGRRCANGGCAVCTMAHTTVGDSSLGNGQFALKLTGVPAGSTVFTAFQIGHCVATGVLLPFLCGPLSLTTQQPVSTLGPIVVPPGAGCAAAPLLFPLPLPVTPSLAGLPVATQCIAFCTGGGSTISNCLSWVAQGN